jgi:hypothetical protein
LGIFRDARFLAYLVMRKMKINAATESLLLDWYLATLNLNILNS